MRTVRQEFDRATKEAAWERAAGKCEICLQPFDGRRPEYHHKIPAALGGDNSLKNCKCICPPCHRIVTRDEDMPRIVKTKRIIRKDANIVPKKQKIRSRGFERGFE